MVGTCGMLYSHCQIVKAQHLDLFHRESNASRHAIVKLLPRQAAQGWWLCSCCALSACGMRACHTWLADAAVGARWRVDVWQRRVQDFGIDIVAVGVINTVLVLIVSRALVAVCNSAAA